MRYRHRYPITEQCGQLVRYLQHCRGYTAPDAWDYVARLSKTKRRDLYGLLKDAIALGQIVWRDGRFVEIDSTQTQKKSRG